MMLIGFPDYYDYCANIYGVDKHVVYDRRGGEVIDKIDWYDASKPQRPRRAFEIAFCGTLYRGLLRHNGKCYYGDDIRPFLASVGKDSYHDGEITGYLASNSLCPRRIMAINKVPTNLNDKHNQPVIYREQNLYRKHGDDGYLNLTPKSLDDVQFSKCVAPDDAYKAIYNWILERKNESYQDVLTDKEKIKSKGLDPIVSFRHRKKAT